MKRTLAIFLMSIGALCAQSAPVIVPNGVVNAADYSRAAAPGALLTIFGRDLSPRVDAAASMPMPSTLQGVSVEVIDGGRTVLAPLYFVSPGQINAMLPYDVGASIQVRVRTAAGVSNADTLAVSARAPRLFSAEAGRALATHRDFSVLTRAKPAKPGEIVLLLVNSMGAVEPGLAAGAGAGSGTPGDPLNLVSEAVTVTIDGRPARVDYAGLMPYLAGLYQINVRMPYYDVAGDLAVTVNAGSSASQGDIIVPVEPNGFYWVLNAGKFMGGQTLNGVSGAGSAIAFAHAEPLWGDAGLGAWTKDIGHGPAFSATAGLALTLKNGSAVVFDNNGIETGAQGTYYDNSRGGGNDSDKPGLMTYFSMSNFMDAIFAGYFRLTERTTFNQMIGYFDGNGNTKLPFDPANVYNGYRMNIWSNGPGNTPRGTSLFVGDVFSSDRASGVFTFGDTGVTRTFSDGAKDPIFRLVYTLNAPVTLEPGEYWFSHDVAVPKLSVQGASQPGTAAAERVRPANSPGARRVRPDSVMRFER
ncbi:MAG: hypothetical protein Q8N47_19655 [Bryobacterales bacterium]|nr:hypothetical protein [Bryobacterales bacterium]